MFNFWSPASCWSESIHEYDSIEEVYPDGRAEVSGERILSCAHARVSHPPLCQLACLESDDPREDMRLTSRVRPQDRTKLR